MQYLFSVGLENNISNNDDDDGDGNNDDYDNDDNDGDDNDNIDINNGNQESPFKYCGRRTVHNYVLLSKVFAHLTALITPKLHAHFLSNNLF